MLVSLKSFVSLVVLSIAFGIGLFLYLTIDTDFEAHPRIRSHVASDPSKISGRIDEISHIINTAKQAWSIVKNK